MADAESSEGSLDEVARLLVLLVRQNMDTQAELISELDRAGIGAVRIASLIGTTPATVRSTLQKQKARDSR